MKNIILRRRDFKKYQIEITEHAFKRWNERVFEVNDCSEIINYINESTATKFSIMHVYKDFYCINDDIICCVIFSNNIIEITTTYGRISNNPCLNNLEGFLNGIAKYGKSNLSLNKND